ncbi:MAG: hypothetical protein JO155_04195, partial [Acidimicrobiia bacterium]|nr:hypothetical protein [Acidimicrobiia bacterium]
MKAEDRLTDLLRDTANGYHPHGGLAQIEDKVAHRRRARRVRRVALPVAAAVVIAAVAVPLALRGGKHHSQRLVNVPPATTVAQPEPGTTQVPAAAKPTTPPSTVFQGPSGGPVPPGFLAASVTFISPSKGWVLGTAPCASPSCTSILRTTDGGATWKGIPAPKAGLWNSADETATVRSLRFANDRDGFAFGDGFWATHDGGAHWHQIASVAGVAPFHLTELV